ncbi:hypothetical protein BKA62DRAFT_689653 [Auriculariales sp. MPI-PUGE-AT-0066]|nr:hypothetical protein BKA62DRAFT_689653 [Auriculariales sp. MPI-PUGE-AT-0066]
MNNSTTWVDFEAERSVHLRTAHVELVPALQFMNAFYGTYVAGVGVWFVREELTWAQVMPVLVPDRRRHGAFLTLRLPVCAMTGPYLDVLKASYDYVAQSNDEVSIKEDQLVFLVERTDDEWWKIKVKQDGLEDKGPVGLVPANYLEEASVMSTVKAQYDYEAAAPGELSIKEDAELLVYEKEEEWLLVKLKSDAKAGYVPANYCEEGKGEEEEEEEEPATQPPAVAPVSNYVDPEVRVAASKASAKNDPIETWIVSEIDAKNKKKKGTLGIGNGSIFFASESDKAPVQKWDTKDVASIKTEKSKHIHIDIGGSKAASLHFHASSSKETEAIVSKLETSRALASTISPPTSPPPAEAEPPSPAPASATNRRTLPPPLAIPPPQPESKREVHFRASPASIIPSPPSREDSGSIMEEEEEEGEPATALYDFGADGEDELTAREGERLRVLDRSNDEWWKCRNAYGAEGVIPASYVELVKPVNGTASHDEKGDDDAEDARLQAEQEEEEREAREAAKRKKEEEQRKKAADAAAAARKDRERKEAERRKREEEQEREDREEQEAREAEEKAKRAEAEKLRHRDRQREREAEQQQKKQPQHRPSSSSGSPSAASSSSSKVPEKERRKPDAAKVRTWHDRTGQFQVDAEFLGFNNGLLRLHKTNGVIIEVPSDKMSNEDIEFIERVRRKAAEQREQRARSMHDDDVPLGNLKQQGPQRKQTGAPEKQKDVPKPKKPTTDWFDWFLNAGCDIDDCTRYAASFERDKIDEAIIPDLKESTLRSLGLREGDIIRVMKSVETRRSVDQSRSRNSEQIKSDEDMARELQQQEYNGTAPDVKRNNTTSPAPNLFANADGSLKAPRRGRPTPSKGAAPSSVSISSIGTVSSDAAPSPSPTPPPRMTTSPGPAPPAKSGFDDDAWAVRPASKSPAPQAVLASAPPAPTPPPPPPVPAASAPAAAPAPVQAAAVAPAQAAAGPVLSAAEQATKDLLDRLAQYRPPSAPVPPTHSFTASPPPSIVTPSASFQSGMGMGGSALPIGQHLQAQQTGMMPTLNGPRGPLAPVAYNQPLLQPLVPTSTGFGGFIPARPQSNPGPGFMTTSQFQPAASPFGNQFAVSQPMLAQPTGYAMTASPMQMQPTGMLGGSFGQFSTTPMASAYGSGFSGVQTNPTGFIPSNPTGFIPSNPTGFGTFGGSGFGAASPLPPVPPLPSSPPQNNAPANIFASMKAGTFAADDSAPQTADKYDVLRQPTGIAPQPTGWTQPMTGYPTYGYGQH